jgi:membrane-associated phospholipid phosphatase
MNDTTAVQTAAWLGAHAVWLYGAASVVLVGVTLLGWRLLLPIVPTRPWSARRWATPCVVSVLGALVFLWLAQELRDDHRLSAFDFAFTDALAGSVPAVVVQAAALLTRLGDPVTLGLLGVVVGAALLFARHVGLMLAWTLALAGNGLLNPALKQLFARMRPPHAANGLMADGFSFPSGHSSGTVVAFGMLAYLGLRLLPRRWHLLVLLAAVLVAFSVGVSRIFLRVHYASDVAAGFASGTAWLAFCLTVMELGRRWQHRAGG